jgi:hypothetical protein
LLIKAKKQYGKNQNKNNGLFINCMDFVVVCTKKTKNKIVIFYRITSNTAITINQGAIQRWAVDL